MQIWCDFNPAGLAADLLRQDLGPHTLIFKNQGAALTDADIALGQPDPAAVLAARRVKWLHITSAGYTKFDFPKFWQAMRARPALVTNSSAVFADPCAQHALAMILSFARALPWSITNQFPAPSPNPNPASSTPPHHSTSIAPPLSHFAFRTSHLSSSPPSEPSHPASPTWTSDPIRKRSFLLTDQRIVLVGYGSIARRLAQLLAPFTRNILGIRRSPRGDESIPILPTAQISAALTTADHVVDLLPQSPHTENFFNSTTFAQFQPGSYFYNIGRGKTVDQPALIAALTSGHLAGAYLDVTDPEPLPPTDPLWTTPNCFITPHSAGGHHNERDRLIAHFLQNLRRYEAGEKLADRL